MRDVAAREATLAIHAEAALTLFVPECPMGTPMESWPRRHRITVHEYHRMAEVGLLAPDARVELIEGEIIDMAPIGKAHTSIVDQLSRLLVRAVGDAAIVLMSLTALPGVAVDLKSVFSP